MARGSIERNHLHKAALLQHRHSFHPDFNPPGAHQFRRPGRRGTEIRFFQIFIVGQDLLMIQEPVATIARL